MKRGTKLNKLREELRELDSRVVHRFGERKGKYYNYSLYRARAALDRKIESNVPSQSDESLDERRIIASLKNSYPLFVKPVCPEEEREELLYADNIAQYDLWLIRTLAERVMKGVEIGKVKYKQAKGNMKAELIELARKGDINGLVRAVTNPKVENISS